METTRRKFLQSSLTTLAGITIVGFVSPTLTGCSDSPVDTGAGDDAGKSITVDVSSLDASGKAVRTSSPSGKSLIVIRRAGDTYVTLLLVCTHQGCSGTQISNSSSQLQCSCHGSTYDLDGKVTGGPATKNLTSFATVYDGATKKVTITF